MFPIACASVASTRSSRNPIRPLWCGRNWSSFSEMKRNSAKFVLGTIYWGINAAALMLGTSLAAYGQNEPPVQQILDRLDRLEKDNQALLEEVRALRQEVSGLRTPSAESPTAQSQT